MVPDTSHKAHPLTRVYAWFSALMANDTDLMDDLLVHGLPVDVPHPLHHTTALMEATRLGRAALVAWLLGHNAAPALLSGRPAATPLHCAIKRRAWDIASCLLERMPVASAIDAYGRTPLHLLCFELLPDHDLPHVLMLAYALVKKSCQLDALDHEGITALHYCVINDHAPLAHVLLGCGANPNILTPDTKVSPLTIAALEKNIPIASMLLEYGANPHIPTHDGATAAAIMPGIEKLKAGSPESAPVNGQLHSKGTN